MVSNSELTVGALTAFMGAAYLFFGTVGALSSTYISAKEDLARLEEVYTLLAMPPEPLFNSVAPPVRIPVTHVDFDEVTFGYEPGTPVLHSLSFTLRQGEFVCLTGPSGGGKSTILRLLLGFYAPESGEIRIDGASLGERDLRAVRATMGVAFQHDLLLNRTIGENITYGREGIPAERIVQAAKAADAHGFISTLPESYDTLVGEGGYTLSGGERQRLCIARALVGNPRVVVLDEATSFIDLVGEERILQRLRQSRFDRITILISHRPSTLAAATRVIEIDNGRLRCG
jgi:ABC-type multidrug transport system fused ATPase/permease subunit